MKIRIIAILPEPGLWWVVYHVQGKRSGTFDEVGISPSGFLLGLISSAVALAEVRDNQIKNLIDKLTQGDIIG